MGSAKDSPRTIEEIQNENHQQQHAKQEQIGLTLAVATFLAKLTSKSENFSSRLGLTRRRRVAVGTFLGLLLLATASAQTITPLYGTAGGMVEEGGFGLIGVANSFAIAPLNPTNVSLPGWVVTAACVPAPSASPLLEVAVWEDTGSALVQTGSYTDNSICINVAVASLYNTSQQGTTIVTGTILVSGALQVAAWQVSPSGSISPLGSPAVDASLGFDYVSITPLAGRVVTAVDSAGIDLKCRAALINENCMSCVFSSFSRLSASGMALNCKKLGT